MFRLLRSAPPILACLEITNRKFSLSNSFEHNVKVKFAPNDHITGYATDIEGNLNYWKNFKAISKVLYEEDGTLHLKKNCQFVYGGDVTDRGSGDLVIIRELLDLKRRYPGRVHFILGNRDLNKIRFLTELQEYSLKQDCKYWFVKDANPLNWPCNDIVSRVKLVSSL